MISYDPFWKTLEEKSVTQYAVISKYGLSRGTLSRIKKQKPLNLVTIEKLCHILHCPIDKVVIIIEDPNPQNKND